jgi:uncharacterized membrane protein YkvA (DUF1232 family)
VSIRKIRVSTRPQKKRLQANFITFFFVFKIKYKNIMENPHYEEDKRKAEKYAGKPHKIRQIIEKAMNKLKTLDIEPLTDLAESIKTLTRLLETYLRGHYQMPWQSAASVIAALLYFITPTDAIPDFILGIGYVDDISVIRYTLQIIAKDLDRFEKWEKENTALN